MKHTRLLATTLCFILLLNLFAACSKQEETVEDTSSTVMTTNTSATVMSTELSNSDTNTTWDDTATKITLNGNSIAVDGSGAEVSGSTLTIIAEGTYVVSGTLNDGQIIITVDDSEKVHLVLNGASITSSSSAAIYCTSGDKLIVTLADGTENTLTDGGAGYTYTDTTNEEPDAALFSKCDLSINGEGKLIINAGFNNGIGTKDDLVIVSGSYEITAANDALRGRDSVLIAGGSLDIVADGDGIHSNNDEDTEKGYVSIEGGELNITAVACGIKAETALSISGGDITVDSTDDSIHTNGSVVVSDGTLTLTSGDDGIHADVDLTVSGGYIEVLDSYEGLEGATVNITGGEIYISASDDGINAAGGSDLSGMGGGFGNDSFSQSSSSYNVNITGGYIYSVAGGDGIDSNGTITISGGTVISLINSTADNEALDCDSGLTITGGTAIYGGTGVGALGTASTQSYVYCTGVSAGQEVSVELSGTTLASFTAEITCQYLAISTPEIQSGSSYDVIVGGTSTATTAGQGVSGGMMGGGQMQQGGDMGGGKSQGGGNMGGGQMPTQ